MLLIRDNDIKYNYRNKLRIVRSELLFGMPGARRSAMRTERRSLSVISTVSSFLVTLFAAVIIMSAVFVLPESVSAYTRNIRYERFAELNGNAHLPEFGTYNFADYTLDPSLEDPYYYVDPDFPDAEEMASKISGIVVYYNRDYVSGIQIYREDGVPTELHGTKGSGDKRAVISIKRDESISDIRYKTNGTHLSQLYISVNGMSYGPYGSAESGDHYEYVYYPWPWGIELGSGDYSYYPYPIDPREPHAVMDYDIYTPGSTNEWGYYQYFGNPYYPYSPDNTSAPYPFDGTKHYTFFDEGSPYMDSLREVIGFWGKEGGDPSDPDALNWFVPITRAHDHGELKKVEGKPATCTEEGVKEHYVCGNADKPCHEIFLEQEVSDPYGSPGSYTTIAHATADLLVIEPLGHDFGEPKYEWNTQDADHRDWTVTATRVCKNDATHVETETVGVYIAEFYGYEGTCISEGKRVFNTHMFNNPAFTVQRKTISIPIDPLNHSFSETQANWSKDRGNVTAILKCIHDPTHVISDTKDSTVTVTTVPTCEQPGVMTYSAKFEAYPFGYNSKEYREYLNSLDPSSVPNEPWSYEPVITEEIPALGHNMGEWVVTAPATEEEPGVMTRTCSRCDRSETKDIPLIVHDWSDPEYKWAEDNASCTASRYCKNHPDEVETEEVAASSEVIASASCIAQGTTRYSVKFENEAFDPQEKEVSDIPVDQSAHDEEAPTFVWSKDKSMVTARVACKRNGFHNIVESVNTEEAETVPASCEEPGIMTYTAKFKDDHFGTQTATEPVPALGHSFGAWKITRTATVEKEGEKERACSRCGKKETENIPKLSPGSGNDTPGGIPPEVTPDTPGDLGEVAKVITRGNSDKDVKGSRFAPLRLFSKKQSTKSIRLNWSKVKGAKKYIIYGNLCGKKTKCKKMATVGRGKKAYNVKKAAGKKLKKGKMYKFIVVAQSGKKALAVSKTIHVRTAGHKKLTNHIKVTVAPKVVKAAGKLKVGRALSLKAKAVTKKGKKVSIHAKTRYESTNKKIATVNKAGKVKAVKKGSCYIYAYAQNGLYKKIKVTVK